MNSKLIFTGIENFLKTIPPLLAYAQIITILLFVLAFVILLIFFIIYYKKWLHDCCPSKCKIWTEWSFTTIQLGVVFGVMETLYHIGDTQVLVYAPFRWLIIVAFAGICIWKILQYCSNSTE
jgi:predicted ABC-type exoprotein transport system permease subunit